MSGPYDFHSFNASAFFGVPYGDIVDSATGKVVNKELRTLAKPINHGANYNMGPGVMADSIGLENVWSIKSRLALPFQSPLEVTEAALTKFHLTYKTLRGIIKFKSPKVAAYFGLSNPPFKLFAPGTWYEKIAMEVTISGMLVSRAYHHIPFNEKKWPNVEQYLDEGDWTRRCFGDPENNKMDLNAYAAHPPQSLNARTLNEAFMQVFYDVALPHAADFRLHAQIHDSIFFSYREGEAGAMLPAMVKERMEIPVSVRDVHGTTRTFTVPAALKLGVNGKLAKYWSETE